MDREDIEKLTRPMALTKKSAHLLQVIYLTIYFNMILKSGLMHLEMGSSYKTNENNKIVTKSEISQNTLFHIFGDNFQQRVRGDQERTRRRL